jgi:nucleoside-diphosphate-sugar epimerase
MKKRILICGATGFIGRNLLDFYYQNDNYNIRAVHFNRPAIEGYEKVEWIKADLRNPEVVKQVLQNVDIVLQFAATTSGAKDITTRPYIHVTDNAVMNSLILRECYEQSIEHFVFPSCTVMYQPSQKALLENDFNGGEEILKTYFGVGNTKVYVEKMCDFFSRLGRTKHTVIRHSNMYGPYDKYDLERSHMFGATITKVMTSTDGKINIWGTGEEARDLLYVEDLVEFIDLAIKNQTNQYELFNVGVGNAISVKEVVNKIIKHSGKDLEIIHDLSKPTIPTSLFLDCSKAKTILGWEPKTDINTGIIKTLNWYKQNIK